MSQTYKNTRPDEISRSLIFRDSFSVLILKTYKAFFDNSGTDSTKILKFKNKIIGTFVKDEYRYSVLTERGCGRNPGPSEVINRKRSRTCIPMKIG